MPPPCTKETFVANDLSCVVPLVDLALQNKKTGFMELCIDWSGFSHKDFPKRLRKQYTHMREDTMCAKLKRGRQLHTQNMWTTKVVHEHPKTHNPIQIQYKAKSENCNAACENINCKSKNWSLSYNPKSPSRVNWNPIQMEFETNIRSKPFNLWLKVMLHTTSRIQECKGNDQKQYHSKEFNTWEFKHTLEQLLESWHSTLEYAQSRTSRSTICNFCILNTNPKNAWK